MYREKYKKELLEMKKEMSKYNNDQATFIKVILLSKLMMDIEDIYDHFLFCCYFGHPVHMPP